MIAFDTNLLVRALVMDNPGQAAIARRLMTEDTVLLSRTVLLETEWVLRSRYNKSRSELLAFFRALLETEDTVIETAEAIGHAVDWYAQGADFADALHLAASGSAVMHTFDRDFCKSAREAGIAPAVQVWDA
jgi:predicted nucleic-acid-binding protein